MDLGLDDVEQADSGAQRPAQGLFAAVCQY